jgi:hypothetical protein
MGALEDALISLRVRARQRGARPKRDARILRASGGPLAVRAANFLAPRRTLRELPFPVRLGILVSATVFVVVAFVGAFSWCEPQSSAPSAEQQAAQDRRSAAAGLARALREEAGQRQVWSIWSQASEIELAIVRGGGCAPARRAMQRMFASSPPPEMEHDVEALDEAIEEACDDPPQETK